MFEKEIDFLSLTDEEFEQICFELLLEMNFEHVQWRKGGADSGRDIQALKACQHQIVDSYYERWFFECKRYSKGVSPEALNSKIAWADSEKPKHLVFFISSYLSNGARFWLEKIETEKYYKIHVLEGSNLKKIIGKFPKLAEKYFSTKIETLILEAQRNWLIHSYIPEAELIRKIVDSDQLNKISLDKTAFIWNSAMYRSSEIEVLIEDSYPFTIDFMFQQLAEHENTSISVLSNEILNTAHKLNLISASSGGADFNNVYNSILSAEFSYLDRDLNEILGWYSLAYSAHDIGVEVLIFQDSSFPVHIRKISTNARTEASLAFERLNNIK